MRNDLYLRKIANKVLFYQIITIICFLIISIIFEMNEILLLLSIPVFFVYTAYILLILIFQDHNCPNCGESFFKKKGTFADIGFSIYTKKCTNCLYKLKYK